MPTNKPVFKIQIVDGGSGSIDLGGYFEYCYIYGTATLTSNWAVTASGTPTEGMRVKFEYRGTVMLNSSIHITIFGTQMPDEYSSKKVNIDVYYNGSVWVVDYQPAFDEDNIIRTSHILVDAITTDKVLNANITLDKVADVTAAHVVMGNPSNRPTATAISGVVSLNSAGVIAHVPGAIVNADVNSAAALELIKLEATTASRALVTDLTGYITAATTTATEVGYLNTSSPGTAVANKALVLGSIKQVDTIDITSLKLGGTALTTSALELNKLTGVTAITAEINKLAGLTSSTTELNKLTGVTTTPTQLNYLATATSDIQTQIDSMSVRTGLGVIMTDTVLTSASLNGSYAIDATAGTVDVTLPQASTLLDGTELAFTHHIAANNVTIYGYAADPGISKIGVTSATALFSINTIGDNTRIILKSGTWYQLN